LKQKHFFTYQAQWFHLPFNKKVVVRPRILKQLHRLFSFLLLIASTHARL